jgi:hypothetical protein
MVCLGLVTLGVPASAQTDSGPQPSDTNLNLYQARQIIPFLEPTDVFLAPRDGTNCEANIFPHLVVYQNFIDAMNRRAHPGERQRQGRETHVGKEAADTLLVDHRYSGRAPS